MSDEKGWRLAGKTRGAIKNQKAKIKNEKRVLFPL
jgi:hypothetical protein